MPLYNSDADVRLEKKVQGGIAILTNRGKERHRQKRRQEAAMKRGGDPAYLGSGRLGGGRLAGGAAGVGHGDAGAGDLRSERAVEVDDGCSLVVRRVGLEKGCAGEMRSSKNRGISCTTVWCGVSLGVVYHK